jgi:hypothetical protein
MMDSTLRKLYANPIYFYATLTGVALCVGILVLSQNTISTERWISWLYAFNVLFAMSWYYASWTLVNALKLLLNDTNCNSKANRFVNLFGVDEIAFQDIIILLCLCC